MRKNDRIIVYDIVHLVVEGSRWKDGWMGAWIYGGRFACGRGYSGFKPDITRKQGVTCLWCLTGRSQL